MKNKSFINAILKNFEKFDQVDGFFFWRNYDYILTGFFCDNRPDEYRVYNFVHPLYFYSNGITLSLSNLIQTIDKSTTEGTKDVTNKIITCVKNANIKSEITLQDYIDIINQKPGVFRNRIIYCAYIYTLVLLDEMESANNHLQEILKDTQFSSRFPNIYETNSNLLQMIMASDNVGAKNIIMNRIDENKRYLNI